MTRVNASRHAMRGGSGLPWWPAEGITWLLRDEFAMGRPAGSLNGTAAEPGPGTRTVADTNGVITIAGGRLKIAGTPASGTGLTYALVTRAAGRMFLLSAPVRTTVNNGNRIGFGDDALAQTSLSIGLDYSTASAFRIKSGVTSIGTVNLLGTVHTYAFVMRAMGGMLFTKADSGAWTLHWVYHTGTANQYAKIVVDANPTNFELEYARIPDAVWLPTPLVSDSFATTFGTSDGLGHAEGIATGIGAGGGGVTWTGATWSVSGGKAINTPVPGSNIIVNGGFDADSDWTKGTGWSIAGGKATKTPGVASAITQPATGNIWYQVSFTISNLTAGVLEAYPNGPSSVSSNGSHTHTIRPTGIVSVGILASATFDGSVDDVVVKPLVLAELLALSNLGTSNVVLGAVPTRNSVAQNGVALNWDSASNPQNGVAVTLDVANNYARLLKCVGGVWSSVMATGITYSAGARLVVTKDDTKYRVYYNNALVGTEQTIADAGIISNTLHGLFSTDASNTLDDFVVYARGNEGQYSALDSYSVD